MTALRLIGLALVAAFTITSPALAAGGGAGAPHLDGGELGLIWIVPFCGILLSIALFPLLAPEFWHHHFGKISAFWAAAFLVPFVAIFGASLALFELLHVLLLEYIPFIILLLSLFTVAGGIRLKGRLVGSPIVNTGILLLGTVLASWMGTTGAAMLLIRPLLRANEGRRYKVHTVVFFIFLVANIGGSLTPLGDPPLFLGFLKGVSFFWPTTHMLGPMLMIAAILLVAYYIVDSILVRREGPKPAPAADAAPEEALAITGLINFVLLGGVIGAVLLSGIWKPHIAFDIYHVHVELQNITRDLLLLLIAYVSWKVTDMDNREANGFTWFPIMEVGKLFVGIFLTIVPAIAILKAGTDGALGGVVALVTNADGTANDVMYFWMTGILSSFLDNAPTYLVFFNTAGGDAAQLMTEMASTLLAISAGAVFMGANTYIGNAPNFMVRAIAEEQNVAMPSFFGYMVWSFGILVPIFFLTTFVFFT
jgi:Na+/H+ antiporter NhaD/arsenite permease-like protein